MTYEELSNLLRQNQFAYSGVTPSSIVAPSVNDIISGIQSQYQPIDLGSYSQPSFGGANRYITGEPSFGDIEKVPEYGTLNQLIGPSFVPSEFDKSVYEKVDTQRLSNLISQIGSGSQFESFGGDSGNSGNSNSNVGPDGLSNTPSIGTMGVTALSMALGAITGLPISLITNVIGKQNVANALNNISHSQDVGKNTAFVANQLGIANSPANAAAIAAAIDSLSATNISTPAAISAAQATQGAIGATGASAAAAAASSAAAAAAAGHSDAAIAAASQAAANATLSGLSPSQVSEQANAAAVSVSISEANAAAGAAAPSVSADAPGQGATGVAPAGGGEAPSVGDGVSGVGPDGVGFAKGGKVTSKHMIGPNPKGKDDGYVALDSGEYVIKKSSVDKYGESLLSLINEGKVSKKKLQSLI